MSGGNISDTPDWQYSGDLCITFAYKPKVQMTNGKNGTYFETMVEYENEKK